MYLPPKTQQWLNDRAWWIENWSAFNATVVAPRAKDMIKMYYGLDDDGRLSGDGIKMATIGRHFNMTRRSARIWIDHAKSLMVETPQPVSVVVMRLPKQYNPLVDDLQLSKRLIGLLKRRAATLNELLALTEEQVREIPGVGDVMLQELMDYLDGRGLKLAQPVS